MRDWRKTNPLKIEALRRQRARNYAGNYLQRGKLQRQPCEVCGGRAQMHHNDYGKPLDVRWFCRTHHLDLHRNEQEFPVLRHT